MPRAMRVCSTPGCPELTTGGRCPTCRTNAEQQRGSAAQRGYGRRHQARFRPGVLARDPLCTCPGCRDHPGVRCLKPSTVADHHPKDRRLLVALGLDPNDPKHGRGLCAGCHNHATAEHQPGGWAAR